MPEKATKERLFGPRLVKPAVQEHTQTKPMISNLLGKEDLLKFIGQNKNLPSKDKDYLQLYLNLENFINTNLGYSKENLRSEIRTKFNTRWLEPRMHVLFNKKNPDQLIFIVLFLESVIEKLAKYIDFKNFKEILRQSIFFRDMEITADKGGLFKAEIKIFSDESKYLDIMIDANELLHSIYLYAEDTLGANHTHRIFSSTYEEFNDKFGGLPKFSAMIRALPVGILDEEKFNLLTKEELESVSKKLARIDTMKSEFTNIAAHELKTPIVPIKGFLSMMKKYPEKYGLNEKGLDYINICLKSAARLEDLVTDILDVSKLETGEMKFEMKELNLAPLLKNELKQLSFLLKETNIALNSKIPDTIMVYGDSHRLSQVIGNLIKNALKFTEEGTVTLKAKTMGDNVRVDVIDTGMGIRKEDLNKLFTKFFQGQDIATRRTKGTGLGLAISKEIIEKHKGKIWAESGGLGKGSTFSFSLPVNNNAKAAFKTK
jgi:signal transduction histidine kinase